MRVAFIAPGFAPALGGVETHVSQVTKQLARLGVDVEAWVHDAAGRGDSSEIRDGVRVHRFPRSGSDRYPVSPALWRHVRRHAGDVDLVHAQSYHVTAALAGLVSPKRTPLVFTPHYHGTGHTRLSTIAHRPYRVLGRRLVERAAAVIAVSGTEKALLLRDFPRCADRCEIIPNAVDTEWIAAADRYPDQPPTLLVLGRLEPYKRVDTVLTAFARCTAPGQLVILGDGPDRGRLSVLAQQHARRDDIRLLGRVGSEAVARWLRSAHAVVSMSEQEAFGLTALEGLAAGARAILSDIPAHREVLDLAGRTGDDLYRHDDCSTLAAALDRALTDPRGRSRAIRDWREVAAEHLLLYERCLTETMGSSSSSSSSRALTVSSHDLGS